MKSVAVILAACIITSASAAIAWAQSEHSTITPQEVKWGPAPPSIPAGAQAAVLYSDPGKEGMFAFRLKFPKSYQLPPHTHPKPEIVTVISGTMH
jgi:quercetin dioxygenase-like cupin family protein